MSKVTNFADVCKIVEGGRCQHELALKRGHFAPAFLRHTGEELDILLEYMFNAPADYISEDEDW